MRRPPAERRISQKPPVVAPIRNGLRSAAGAAEPQLCVYYSCKGKPASNISPSDP